MSASQSNLSDPHFGYDIVVATTQASINAGLKQYLAGVSSPEVIVCYVFDPNNNLVPIPYSTLKDNAKGSDPFAVPDGADTQTNQNLINLTQADFAGAFKARIGLPPMPVAELPPVVTLGNGTDAPVVFNLLCAEFEIVGFQFLPRGRSAWINQSQTATDPWYFTSNVELNRDLIDPSLPVPPDVQARIQALLQSVGPGAFSLQRLFLDLDTAILLSSPTVSGIPPGWPVWELIESQFLGAYFKQLQQSGQPVLGYAVVLTQPDPSNVQLGAMTRICSALRGGNGQIIPNPTPAQQAAATLDYLCTVSTTPPVANEFPWNWVEADEVTDFSGVLAVRRSIFASYLAGVVNGVIGGLCQATTVELHHSGETYHISYSSAPAGDAASFSETQDHSPGADGFAPLLAISYQHNSHDDSEAADHFSSIHGDFNYALNGTLAVNNNSVRLIWHAQAFMKFNHHEAGINYDDLPLRNYYDKTLTVSFQLNVDSSGRLNVPPPVSNLTDASAGWDFHPGGILGIFGLENNVKKGLGKVETELTSILDRNFGDVASRIESAINGFNSWVFPAGQTFLFSQLLFSSSLDLISHITFADPN